MNKSKRKPPIGFAACYNYKSSFGMQIIAVKYADDVTAIDILLAKDFQRQARFIVEGPDNKILKIK